MLMNTNHSLRSNDYHLRIWFSRYPKEKIPGRYGGVGEWSGYQFCFCFLICFWIFPKKNRFFCSIPATFWYCWIRSGQAGLSQIDDENLSECCQIWPVESKRRKTWVGVRILGRRNPEKSGRIRQIFAEGMPKICSGRYSVLTYQFFSINYFFFLGHSSIEN